MPLRESLMKLVPAQDKLIHSWYGAIISTLYIPCLILNINSIVVLGIALIAAIGNEVYQKVTKTGVVDLSDIVFTMIIPSLCYVISAIK